MTFHARGQDVTLVGVQTRICGIESERFFARFCEPRRPAVLRTAAKPADAGTAPVARRRNHMIGHAGRVLLLDIEGTTSSVRYVYDVLFPYARRELAGWLERHWTTQEAETVRRLAAKDASVASFAGRKRSWQPRCAALMDRDAKATGLKELQGHIWRDGFERRPQGPCLS